jgi:uncharacterized protein YyaL (SSP411 family)
MWDAKSGMLLRRYREGHAEIDGYAEDYAYMIYGLLELFQADPQPMWLEWAIALQRRRTSCSGTSRAAAGSAPPGTTQACCCG